MAAFRKISVVGAGAIGGYYGAKLLRSGNDVSFVARSDREVLTQTGIEVQLPNETFFVPPVQAVLDPLEIGPCDLVLIALKATAHPSLLKLVAPLLHEKTIILTLENGLGSDELLAAEFGAERVAGGLCFICVNRIAPGKILCLEPGTIALGAFGRAATPEVRAIAELLTAAGIKCSVGDNLAELRWRKLVWNIPFNGLSVAAGGVTTDKLLASPALENELRALMEEVRVAAACFGFSIPSEFLERQITSTRPMGAYKPSTLVDFLASREIEVEAIWGEPLRRAQNAGAVLPRLSMLYALLKSLGPKAATVS